jgi:hypothetical protein
MRFGLLTAVVLIIEILCDAELCRLGNRYRSFVALLCLGSSSAISMNASDNGAYYVNSVDHYKRATNSGVVQSANITAC